MEEFLAIQKKGAKLFKKKNKDYGNAFATYGPIGVMVRIGDKINRLMHVTKNGVNMVDNETIEDTLLDLHNYSAMALMLLNEPLTELRKQGKSFILEF